MLRAVRVRSLTLLGPAFVAAVAYVDPGNVATNVTAGARFGFALVWVVVLANVMAVLVQYLSAKLGLVTRTSLAEQMGSRLSRPARIAYWAQAELVAIATDLAEIVGGALALYLLFDLPLVLGALITTAVSIGILKIGDWHGQSALERVVMAFLLLIAVGFTAGLFVEAPDPAGLAGGLLPGFSGADSVLLASGIIGATVMPHVIYLHSGLTSNRLGRRASGLNVDQLLVVTRVDVVVALLVAGTLNLALLVVAATNFAQMSGTGTLQGVYELMSGQLGTGIAILFAVALMGSGLASTSVGCAAGAEVMQGLLHRRVPMLVRRLVTAIPALLVLGLGIDASYALIISQVVLSIGIPFALAPLVWLTTRRSLMGMHVNRPGTTVAAVVVVVLVVSLNFTLLGLTLF